MTVTISHKDQTKWVSNTGLELTGYQLPLYLILRLTGGISTEREYDNEMNQIRAMIIESEVGTVISRNGETFKRIE
jgi:hypothetical protein